MWRDICTSRMFLHFHKDPSLGCTLCSGRHTASAVPYREEGCEEETQAGLEVSFHPYLEGIAASFVLEWLSMAST